MSAPDPDAANTIPEDLLRLLPISRGHFQYESGYHGDLWLDLERLCLDVRPIRTFASQLADRLAPHRLEVVCGPLVEGAFVALLVAEFLELPFTYTNRIDTHAGSLYPIEYRVPKALRAVVDGRRIGIVTDVISAGSAVGGTLTDVLACGGRPVSIGALVALGEMPGQLAKRHGVPLEALAAIPSVLWRPDDCPLCAEGLPLSREPPTA